MTEVDAQHGRVLGHRDLQRPQDGAVAAQRDDELAAGVDAVRRGARPQVDDLEAVPRRPRPDRQQLRSARAGRLGEHAHGRGLRRRCQRERLHAPPALQVSGAARRRPAVRAGRRRRPHRTHGPRASPPPRRGARRRAPAPVASSRPAAVRLGGAAVQVIGIRRRRAQARQQRLQPLAGRDVVGDHRRALHADRLQREGTQHPGPILARGAVDDDTARGVRDVVQRAHHRVGAVGQVLR